MANNIALFEKYIPLLDEVYKAASKSAVLDSAGEMVTQGRNANEFLVPKMTLDGLGEYSRKDGYARGDVTLVMETIKAEYDRGRKFSVDAMDDEETAGVAFGRLSSVFIREKVVPEMDAYRFAKYAGKAQADHIKAQALTTADDILSALIAGKSAMDEAEVGEESRYLFIAPTLYNAALNADTSKSRVILDSFGGRIISVPQGRFKSKIELKDGKSTGQEAGGFAPASDALDINFMMIDKNAVLQFARHNVNKIITPEANQEDDSFLFFYRAYMLAAVYDNKADGIYLHTKDA